MINRDSSRRTAIGCERLNDQIVSRIFTVDDPQLNNVILEIPQIWWSRPYEYAWAASFVEGSHIVLDAACGLCHPFKFFLCNICRNVHACDYDERILSPTEIMNDMVRCFGLKALNFPLDYLFLPHLSRQDIIRTNYSDSMFDRIFCLSVLEHLDSESILEVLQEFKRILKDDGLVAVTIDVPYLELENFNQIVKKSGLTYFGETILEIPENVLKTDLFPEFLGGLYSFRALLKKKIIGDMKK